MKVIATNIGKPTRFVWKGKTEETGIFKYPVSHPIFLGHEDVDGDTVTDRKHHGGEYKACYLFSSEHYGYWKERFPDLPWSWGMFGENITLERMDESNLLSGSVYELGSAVVQVTIPREPCYKLGIRFGDQKIIDEFIHHGHPGTYLKVIRPGQVGMGDRFSLLEKAENSLSIADLYSLLYAKEKDQEMLRRALECPFLPDRTKVKLGRYQKKGA
ncbi:MOSC domain-containing protein YiiM [Muriicola jejuensis]|uniref:MOSC domain-containing protein n=1 Tax=Muriicola jejuensis TaxID=504488 RepID=A0A6P0UB98_9FLAO|nr:MOSC domain-containing protein [Muriicola jejuensis]NER09169.1 MOSC domain-containing protein [Muriicola jejuensis]SMP10694.1 MOSC domain-containing protein YiiM [Muriicola jejuensis]